jgi:hypothetical protein
VNAPNKNFAKRGDEGSDEQPPKRMRAGAGDAPAKRGGQGRSFGKRGPRR